MQYTLIGEVLLAEYHGARTSVENYKKKALIK